MMLAKIDFVVEVPYWVLFAALALAVLLIGLFLWRRRRSST